MPPNEKRCFFKKHRFLSSRADFQTRIGMRQGVPGRPEVSQAVRGEIIDKDESSITVKLPDESSKIVLIKQLKVS